MARAAIPSAKWDLALISAFLMLQATTWLRLSNYLSGRTNAAAADLCFAYFWFGVLAAVLLWGGYVVLAVLAHNKVTHVQNVARAVGICVMAVIIVAAIFAPAPGEQAFHRGFRQWLGEKELDIPSIRTWQSSLGVTPGGDVPQDLWPRSVRVLEPRVVRFLGPKAGVDIRWGGGFLGMWGVVVGPDRLEIPAEDCGTYIVVFRQGVYMHFPKG
ncbi:MAG: hypothetical protein NTY65_17280 [Planctomycetota bacterium]|nr:hypothetical protein [Planctomycetota bacterium]